MAMVRPPAVQAATFGADGNLNDVSQITKDIKIDEHRGGQLPLDLSFVDESGQRVQLRRYFTGKRPVVLQLGYYGCPMLCSLISRGTADAMGKISLVPGSDYEMVFVSIDPRETPALAAAKKQSYLQEAGHDAAGGWHFLTGSDDAIHQLAASTGFTYRWIASAGQYAHPAAIIICMPDGRISRYLRGVRFDPQTVRLSLVEASDGKIGSVMDEVYLTCFQFDGQQGKYALAAISLMRTGGVLIMIIVATVLIRMFRREARQLAAEKAASDSNSKQT